MYFARRRRQAAIPVFRRRCWSLVYQAGKSRYNRVMAHPPHGSAQKERIRFALYCAAVILRRFLFQGAVARPELGTAERGTLLFKSGLE